jgi:hypothetical protein
VCRLYNFCVLDSQLVHYCFWSLCLLCLVTQQTNQGYFLNGRRERGIRCSLSTEKRLERLIRVMEWVQVMKWNFLSDLQERRAVQRHNKLAFQLHYISEEKRAEMILFLNKRGKSFLSCLLKWHVAQLPLSLDRFPCEGEASSSQSKNPLLLKDLMRQQHRSRQEYLRRDFSCERQRETVGKRPTEHGSFLSRTMSLFHGKSWRRISAIFKRKSSKFSVGNSYSFRARMESMCFDSQIE